MKTIEIMNNNFIKYSKILILSIIFAFCTNIQGQNEKEIIIPIIQYEPYNWNVKILEAFDNPNSKYLKLISKSLNFDCYIYNGRETYHGPRNWKNEERKIENFTDIHYSLEGLYSNIIARDSIFIICFEPNSRFTIYDNIFPIKYYGIVKNGLPEYYMNSKENRSKLTLHQVIEAEYGSVEKYKEVLVDRLKGSLNFNIHNGIYKVTLNSAINFLRHEFSYYNECFPNQKEQTLKLFYDFLDKNICYSDNQRKMIISMINETVKTNMDERADSIQTSDKYNSIKVIGHDITFILKKYLNENQFLDLIDQNRIRIELKHTYIDGPLNIRYIKISDDSTKSSKWPVWNESAQRAISIEMKGEYRRASKDEQLQIVKDLVFGKE